MFHDIPQPVLDQMSYLEGIDAQDRQDGTQFLKRLRQISPETGRLLAILAADTPKGTWLEIGTSAGYSALWLTRAAALRDAKLVSKKMTKNTRPITNALRCLSSRARKMGSNNAKLSRMGCR